ncbi:MAG: hypothetical protein LBJ00_02415 [Planctomycetaceae bacterium]|nr:hypothetical protein [Planctomycetaceae bacterium]
MYNLALFCVVRFGWFWKVTFCMFRVGGACCPLYSSYFKFMELNTQAQQREAVVQGRSLSPYRLRYNQIKKVLGLH